MREICFKFVSTTIVQISVVVSAQTMAVITRWLVRPIKNL